MVCIEKCLHFKRKCRHHPHPILDILPVYLTRGISIASGLFVSSIPFFGTRKTPSWKQGLALTKEKPRKFNISRTSQYNLYLRNSRLANTLCKHSLSTGIQYLWGFQTFLYITRILLSHSEIN